MNEKKDALEVNGMWIGVRTQADRSPPDLDAGK